MALLLTLIVACGEQVETVAGKAKATPTVVLTPRATPTPTPTPAPLPPAPELPGGGHLVFPGKFLVAYYGTAQTDSMGVLGEGSPEQILPRLRAAAKPFTRPGQRPQPVFELIATVVDPVAGSDGDFSHDIPHELVKKYINFAHQHDLLLILDIQPGRSDFLKVVKRWEWALKDPWVGLALDPEWRMGPGQVPNRRVGSVDASEINRVSAWLDDLTRRNRLPQKIFMLHQFKASMIRRPELVAKRRSLATVLHVDGFGNPAQKLSTFRRVVVPGRFWNGFKLFYDEDKPLMSAAAVLAIKPEVRFVSFQ